MVTIREKTVVKMRLDGACPSHSLTEVSTRDVKTIVDEPAERGGTNKGPSPTETLMAALIACTNVITHKVAEKNGVDIKSLHVKLEADFDRRGVRLVEEVEVPFPAITLFIDMATDAPADKVELVKKELPMFCAVSKVMRASGSQINEIWNVTRG